MKINTRFQKQAAKIILDLLDNNKIKIRELCVDSDDRRIDNFQLLSVEVPDEICIVQQAFFLKTGEKKWNLFIKGCPQKWDDKIVQDLINAVIEKLKTTPDIKIKDDPVEPLFC